MMQVVKAKCPHCRNLLRIPAAWISQAMKCKHCHNLFQAQEKSSQALVGAGAAAGSGGVAAMASAPVFPGLDGGHDANVPAISIRASRRKSGAWKGLLVMFSVMAAVAVAVVVAGPRITSMLEGGKGPEVAEKPKKAPKIVDPLDDDSPRPKKIENPPVTPPKKVTPPVEPPPAKPPETKKVDPPPVRPPETKKVTPPPPPPPAVATKLPRRALFIHASNYLYLNQVPSRMGYLAAKFTEKPLKFDRNQVFVLSDNPPDGTGKGATGELTYLPMAPQKARIEKAIADFCESSREQDRIMVVFVGHAVEIEKEAFLIPIDGQKDDKETLIPLKTVYDQLAKSKARQKVLLLDAFRQSATGSADLPAPDVMSEDFDAVLQAPPEGVQVWSACVKEQPSVELESGGAFLQALYDTLDKDYSGQAGFVTAGDPLPLEELVPKVNQRLKATLEAYKKDDKAIEQISRLTGKEKEGGAAPDKDQAEAAKVIFLPAAAAAANAEVDAVLSELAMIPPMKASMRRIFELKSASLPPFAKDALDGYEQEGFNPFKDKVTDANRAEMTEKFPLRVAVFDAAQKIEESHRFSMRATVRNPGANGFDVKFKASILKEMETPGKIIFELEDLLGEFEKLNEMRDKEKSKRWLAHFDYTFARLKGRFIQMQDYQYLLALIRSDSMPELQPTHAGWKIGGRSKVSTNEPKVRDLSRKIGKDWDRIAQSYPDTPWAVLALREKLYFVGLEWIPTNRAN